MKTTKIISKKLFWDTDIDKLDAEEDKFFIISRILENGDSPEIKWMRRNYDKSEIIDVLKNSRQISPKSANYWAIIYNYNGDIRCLQKEYLNRRKKHWSI